MPTKVVRWLQALSTTQERWEQVGRVLRSFLDARSRASTAEEEDHFCGFTEDSRRWVGLFPTLWINWRAPANSWRLGEWFWMLRWVGRGLVREFADGGIFGQKVMQLFVVEGWCCGEDEG